MNKDDRIHISINSVRGHIAEGVKTLVGRLLEKEKEVPEELYILLEQFAADPVEAVRIHVLELFAFLEYKNLERDGFCLGKRSKRHILPFGRMFTDSYIINIKSILIECLLF